MCYAGMTDSCGCCGCNLFSACKIFNLRRMVFMVCLVFAVDMQFTQYGREIGESQNFRSVRLIPLVVVVAAVVIYSQLAKFLIYEGWSSWSAWSLRFTCNSDSMAERQGRGRTSALLSCVRLIWLGGVVALAVVHSQLTIFQLTKNGLHGLSGLSGLHANHRVWQERGISSDALFCYTTNSQGYQVGHSWFAWSLWSACKSLYDKYLVLSSHFFL